MIIESPHTSEFNAFYAGYIGKVSPAGPLALLQDQIAVFERLRSMTEPDAAYAYESGKWTIKELIGHMSDTERMFSYRLLHIVRADPAPLAGMDENAWMAVAPHAQRPMAALIDEMIAVRRGTIALVQSIDADAMARTGIANGFPISARALCWIVPGHAQHHLGVLRERYGVTAAS